MFNISMLLQPVVIEYIRTTLNEEQQIWLTNSLSKDPKAFLRFAMTQKGHAAALALFQSFRDSQMPDIKKIEGSTEEIVLAKKPKLMRVNGEWREVIDAEDKTI